MRKCIICRMDKSEDLFNDEHVIPDSISGYYHINKVCKECNSKIGSKIDSHLTNHLLIEFQRHLLKIKGKKGKVPNPLKGTHEVKETGQKVRLDLDSEGKFAPRYFPLIPQSINDSQPFIIDARDKSKIEPIIKGFAKKQGLSRSDIKVESTLERDRKWIVGNFAVDTKKFKMALLKIAYEFTVDQVKDYFDDPMAKVVSNLLLNADFDKLYDSIVFYGDGIDNRIVDQFSRFINFNDNNHYLVLLGSETLGLICYVNLFATFYLGIKMSDKPYLIGHSIVVGINDINQKKFSVSTLENIINKMYPTTEYNFQFHFKDQESYEEFILNENIPSSSVYKENNDIPFYNSNGEIIYNNIELKLHQKQLKYTDINDQQNKLITNIILDEELYIRLLPMNKLCKVVSVNIERIRK